MILLKKLMMTLSCVLFAVCAQAATVHLDGSRDDVVVLAGRSAAEVKDAIVLPANACESHREAARELRKYLAQITGRGPAMKVFLERGPDELGADGFRL